MQVQTMRGAASGGAQGAQHNGPSRDAGPGSIRLRRQPPPSETRSAEQLYEQYVVEKELAARLMNASEAERGTLYSAVYEDLYRRIPHHSQLRNKVSADDQAKRIARQFSFLEPWLTPDTVFLEIGAGDCALSFAVAKKVAHVYGLDVSPAVTFNETKPENFTLVLSDGTSIPVPDGSITLAFSNQLMEHLHPKDALRQLQNIYRSLAPGGNYVCLTPNRLTGPHDISRYFDRTATGFHLKEYTCGELIELFRKVGFKSVHQCFRSRRSLVRGSDLLTRGVERSMENLPSGVSDRLARNKWVRGLLEIRLIATK